MSHETDRRQVLRRLVHMRRELESLIKALSTSDVLRDWVIELDSQAFGDPHHYDGPEDPHVVAQRWGVDMKMPDGEIPQWVRVKIGHHIVGDTLDPDE